MPLAIASTQISACEETLQQILHSDVLQDVCFCRKPQKFEREHCDNVYYICFLFTLLANIGLHFKKKKELIGSDPTKQGMGEIKMFKTYIVGDLQLSDVLMFA